MSKKRKVFGCFAFKDAFGIYFFLKFIYTKNIKSFYDLQLVVNGAQIDRKIKKNERDYINAYNEYCHCRILKGSSYYNYVRACLSSLLLNRNDYDFKKLEFIPIDEIREKATYYNGEE